MGGLAGPGSRENMVFTENGFELKSVIYPKQPATQTAGKPSRGGQALSALGVA